ncbi:DUF4091 domain-containing protein [Thalassobacillus pellis]|uniref:DUF4091 domain-containing protein n=1 Tax=Thalassobacillus pellis TaxID=748008 RepID=UPI0019605F4A|nr:DUF4091 domain-containing protein [Thalassobacillus pellis]MBM7551578.1 hypothetical protein [Thalassobacillus pellis]
MVHLETKCVSSLEKVFPDEELKAAPYTGGTALKAETFSFQVAYRNNGELLPELKVMVESEISEAIEFHSVGVVPSELPSYHDHDSNVLRTTPGLYPDPLYPEKDRVVAGLPNQWRALWFSVNIPEDETSGVYPIHVIFRSGNDVLARETFHLEILDARLPDQQLIHTEWFHADCLAVHYDVPVFSKDHWKLIDTYLQNAVAHGVNMILTPLFTPPLDTEIGAERPTVQLIDVEKKGSSYSFDFSNLRKWIEIAQEKGIVYFEFSHFFTQWGAKHAPKIIAVENGQKKVIFGWETEAAGIEYKTFLSQFLPELITFIKEHNLVENVYFHVSDEPDRDNLFAYKEASKFIHSYLSDYPVIDALSDYDYYKKGIVKQPIPASDHINTFLEQEVPDLWTYYCCKQYKKVSNRFFNFPSARNRIIGFQLYKFNIKGFLHWGYNFWFSKLSREHINPFLNTDAGHGFPSGDAFLVYPGENGPINSIRIKVFYEALQDLRALQLLETYLGKEQVIELIENSLEEPLTFEQVPLKSSWLINKRNEINQRIVEEAARNQSTVKIDR